MFLENRHSKLNILLLDDILISKEDKKLNQKRPLELQNVGGVPFHLNFKIRVLVIVFLIDLFDLVDWSFIYIVMIIF